MRIIRAGSIVGLLALMLVGFASCRDSKLTLFKQHEDIDSVAGNYLSAHFAQQLRRPKEAADYFEAALKKEPDNIELLGKGTRLYLESGQILKAAEVARLLHAKGHSTPESTLLLTIEAFKAKEYETAEKILSDEALQKNRDGTAVSAATSDWVLPLLKGWALVGQGRYSDAIGLFEKQLDTRLSSFVQYQLALVHDLAGNKKEAKDLFNNVLENAGRSLRLTEVTANFYTRIGEDGTAKEIAARFAESSPNLAKESFLTSNIPAIQNAQHGAAELLLEVASFLYSNRLDEMSLEYANMSLHLRPDFPHGKLLQSNLLRAQERLDEAIDVLETITYPPYFSWQAQLSVARIYQEKEEYDTAERMLRSLASENVASNRQALLTLGDIYMEKKEYDKAVDIYNELINTVEDEQQDWTIFYARGIAYERTEQWDKAEEDFFYALSLKKNQPDVLNYLGYSWLVLGKNIEEAEEMLKTAITLRPGDAHIIDSYGWALYKRGNYEQSVKYLERATLLLPYDPTTNDHLGDVYWKLGRTNEARFQWERALSFKPKPEDEILIEAKLKDGLDAPALAEAKTLMEESREE